MRVIVLHNAVPDDAPLEDRDTLVQVETVVAALERLGHEATQLACTLDLASLHEGLQRQRPEMVFNLVESLAEADSLAHLPLAVLDALGVPYAGNRTDATYLTAHKVLAKHWMKRTGLPTPAWMESLIESSTVHEGHEAPEGEEGASLLSSCTSWIIKGVWDQASRGMDDDAVLKNVSPSEVQRRLAERTKRTGRPCFAEQFIEGREFNLAMLAGSDGPQVLAPAEIDFSAFPPGKPRIVGHRAKWLADSFEYNHTPRRFDFTGSDGPLLQRLQSLASACWNTFGLRGWVRVDFRVDESGQPWILEINTNPCLSPDAGFAAALAQAGIPFDVAVQRILEDSRRD